MRYSDLSRAYNLAEYRYEEGPGKNFLEMYSYSFKNDVIVRYIRSFSRLRAQSSTDKLLIMGHASGPHSMMSGQVFWHGSVRIMVQIDKTKNIHRYGIDHFHTWTVSKFQRENVVIYEALASMYISESEGEFLNPQGSI